MSWREKKLIGDKLELEQELEQEEEEDKICILFQAMHTFCRQGYTAEEERREKPFNLS